MNRDNVVKLVSEVGGNLGSSHWVLGWGFSLSSCPPFPTYHWVFTSIGLAVCPWGKPDLKSFFQ